jgi:cysteine desulfuration protein SufE
MNKRQDMKSMAEDEAAIITEFQAFPNIDAKYEHLFELAEQLPVLEAEQKTDENLVKGCQSKLWFSLQEINGKYTLLADSDSFVIKGIVALLARLIDGRSSAEIQNLSMDFIDRLEIWKLPSERNNGLIAMLDHIKNQVAGGEVSEHHPGSEN